MPFFGKFQPGDACKSDAYKKAYIVRQLHEINLMTESSLILLSVGEVT